MKKEIIDGYEVYSENGEFKNIIFICIQKKLLHF